MPASTKYQSRSKSVAISITVSVAALTATATVGCGSENSPSATETRTVTSESVDQQPQESEGGTGTKTPRIKYLSDTEPIPASQPVENGSAEINGKLYPHSVTEMVDKTSIPSREVEYNLGRRWEILNAVTGIRDDSPSECSVKFEIFADGRSLHDGKISLGESANISIPIKGALRLKLSVSYTGSAELNDYCYAVWGDVRLTDQP